MKVLGLIGGTSWHSTIEYYKLINQLAGNKMGTQGNPPLILHSINIELMREQNKEKINTKYLEVSRKLEQAGAEAILICANTPHMTYEFVQPQITIPILHIAESIGNEAQNLGMKTLGLLGNKPTMTGGFIQSVLKSKFDIETIIPEQEYLKQSHAYVSHELTKGKFTNEAKQFFIEQINLLNRKGADGIILGCTELPLLIKKNDVVIPTLASTDLHAQMAVDFIFS